MRAEFLLEEPSMENVLRILLPRILPSKYILDENCFLRPHNGKGDLLKSIPVKVRTFSNFYEPVKIIILHDQDSNDCKLLKKKIQELCDSNGDCPTKVRIVCRELESWYLGDMSAIEKVYPKFKKSTYFNKEKFRDPDSCNSYYELKKIIPEIQKGFASRNIPNFFNLDENKSKSFQAFVNGIKEFLS